MNATNAESTPQLNLFQIEASRLQASAVNLCTASSSRIEIAKGRIAGIRPLQAPQWAKRLIVAAAFMPLPQAKNPCLDLVVPGLDGTGLGDLPGTYTDIGGDCQPWLRIAWDTDTA